MSVDGRVAAWIGAWDCLEAAVALREKFKDHHTELASYLNHLHRQAEIYAALAAAPDAVGAVVGALLEQRKEQDKQSREMLREFIDGTGAAD